MLRSIVVVVVVLSLGSLVAGCNPKPREQYVQWVARDAWNAECAEKAIVERFKQEGPTWVEQGKRLKVDVDATFKLGNDCGEHKAYKSFEFKAPVEMVRCEQGGKEGWALPGKEADRCWTGPSLVVASDK